jgi:hypothetical protein
MDVRAALLVAGNDAPLIKESGAPHGHRKGSWR